VCEESCSNPQTFKPLGTPPLADACLTGIPYICSAAITSTCLDELSRRRTSGREQALSAPAEAQLHEAMAALRVRHRPGPSDGGWCGDEATVSFGKVMEIAKTPPPAGTRGRGSKRPSRRPRPRDARKGLADMAPDSPAPAVGQPKVPPRPVWRSGVRENRSWQAPSPLQDRPAPMPGQAAPTANTCVQGAPS